MKTFAAVLGVTAAAILADVVIALAVMQIADGKLGHF